MKLIKTCLFLLMAALLLAGCESISDRFSAVPPRMQVFSGDRAAVSAAAAQAFKRLDFRVTRAKSADIEAVSRIHTSVAFADSRQLTVRLHLNDAGPGKTEVELNLTEEVQSQSMGGTRQKVQRENGFFQIYFATLQQVLDERPVKGPDGKN